VGASAQKESGTASAATLFGKTMLAVLRGEGIQLLDLVVIHGDLLNATGVVM